MAEKQRIGTRNWILIVVLGLAGQVAWNLENQWFNVYVYNEITTDPRPVSWMVGVSAVVAALTTLWMGALSDRLGKRRPFILFGYVFWGISTMLFPLSGSLGHSIPLAVALVILLDAIMTFFGSTANDGAYNSWTTDVSGESNRGSLALILSALPLISMVVVSAVAGFAVEAFGYTKFFLFTGALVSAVGLLAGLALRDSPDIQPAKEKTSLLQDLLYTVRPETVRANSQLYLVLITLCIFCTAMQVVLPYLMVYINKYLQFALDEMGLYIGIAFLCGLALALPMILLVNKGKLLQIVFFSAVVVTVGTCSMYFVRPKQLMLLLALASVFLCGYIAMSAALTAWVKNLMPSDARGRFEGIRMIFFVALPMVIGPAIGSGVILRFGAGETLVQDGQVSYVPVPEIFLFAAAVSLLAFIPLLVIRRTCNTNHPK